MRQNNQEKIKDMLGELSAMKMKGEKIIAELNQKGLDMEKMSVVRKYKEALEKLRSAISGGKKDTIIKNNEKELNEALANMKKELEKVEQPTQVVEKITKGAAAAVGGLKEGGKTAVGTVANKKGGTPEDIDATLKTVEESDEKADKAENELTEKEDVFTKILEYLKRLYEKRKKDGVSNLFSEKGSGPKNLEDLIKNNVGFYKGLSKEKQKEIKMKCAEYEKDLKNRGGKTAERPMEDVLKEKLEEEGRKAIEEAQKMIEESIKSYEQHVYESNIEDYKSYSLDKLEKEKSRIKKTIENFQSDAGAFGFGGNKKDVDMYDKLRELGLEEEAKKFKKEKLGAYFVKYLGMLLKEMEKIMEEKKAKGEGEKEEVKPVEAKKKTEEIGEHFVPGVSEPMADSEKIVVAGKEMEEIGGLKINKEVLINSGFVDLGEAGKEIVLYGLKQLVLDRVKEEALKKYNEGMRNSGILRRIGKSIAKNFQIVELEKEAMNEIRGGKEKYEPYLEMSLTQLVEMAKGGPRMEKNIQGEIIINYLEKESWLTEEKQIEIDKFNEIATQFARLPAEWFLTTAKGEEKKRFEKLQKEYETAKEDVANLLKISTDEQHAISKLLAADKFVKMHQFLTVHPEVEKELEKIKGRSAWGSLFANVAVERGGYMVAGAGLRHLTTSIIGLVGLPLAAAITGSWIARRRAKQGLREKEMLARRGEESKEKGIKRLRHITKAEESTEKLQTLMKKYYAVTNEDERKIILKLLRQRAEYTEMQLNNGLINFGAADRRMKNKLDLTEALAQASMDVEFYKFSTGEEAPEAQLIKRLKKFLGKKGMEGYLQKSEGRYLLKQMAKGAAYGAGFAAAGWAARHLVGDAFSWGKAGVADEASQKFSKTTSPEEFRKQYPGLKYEMGIKDAEAKLEEAVKATTGVETTETAAPAISPEQTESAAVGKGEGMWHAVRRQIEDLMNKDPEAFAKRFGLAEENFDSPEEVKKVLDRETMELLVKNKYINLVPKNKTEIRISNPGTRVILGEDNKINIVDESGAQAKVYETELGKVEGRGGLPKELPDSGAAADVLRDAGWVKSGVEAVEGKPGAQWARIDYPNDYKLRMVAIDADGNGAPEEIRILNENDEIIKSSILDSQKGENVKDFVDRAKAESDILIETRNSAFKNIVGDKIIMAQAKEAGINVFTKEDLLPAAKEKLTFWVGHANLLHTPEAAKEYFTLSEATKIDYKSPDFQDYFRRLPADLDGTQKEGYMEVHAGMPAQKEGGLIKLFGEEIRKSGSVDEKIEKFFTEKNDIFIIHDACGKKGFDILITKDKIGVDGPGRWNWGTKGWFGDIRPVHDFNNLGIKTAKTIIENMSKELENRQSAISP